MKIKNNLKSVWKSIMRACLKIYTGNFKLYILNDPKNLPKEKYYSQFSQDIFVLKNIFNGQKNGFFVDVGANHPINGNNTYLLELNGWHGLAIEPQKSLRELWPLNRQTDCLNCVIGPENKEISFVEGNSEENGLSGIEGYNKCKTDFKKIIVQQKKLADLLIEKSITNIDYLSIDVEGYEMNVLMSIDFTKANIKLISVENDIGFRSIPIIGKRLGSELGNNELREYLINKGYKYIARIMCDDFFIKNNNE